MIAVNPNEGIAQEAPNTFEKAVQFPPGTPQTIIDHYQQLYDKAKEMKRDNE